MKLTLLTASRVVALPGLAFLPFAAMAQADDPALQAPPVNLAPGAEYSDSARMFQGIPALECAPNGRLWVAWYGGGAGEDRFNYDHDRLNEKQILMASFTESDVLAGKCVSSAARLQVPVNQATGIRPTKVK